MEPEIRLYLDDAPDATELKSTLDLLGIGAAQLVRTGEADFKEAGLTRNSGEAELVAAMAARPQLIERPIVVANGQARIGRPPEAVLDIL